MKKSAYKKKRIFLDHASATPIRAEVARSMKPFLFNHFENPSALYAEGVAIRKVIETARKEIATTVQALPHEVIFTSSGTEADNLALFGIVREAKKHIKKPHLIVSSFEHPAILEAARVLEREGVDVTYLPISEDGFVDPISVRNALTSKTVLVSVMYANNEIGTIQDIRGITREVRHYKKQKKTLNQYPYVHSDIGQAFLYEDIRLPFLGLDLMTLDGAKVYGPKGIGALIMKGDVLMQAHIVGGGQEFGKRSGTEHVAVIVGFATAIRVAKEEREERKNIESALRNRLWKGIQKRHPHVHMNGHEERRLANNVNICIPDVDSEYLVLKLDARGILVSPSSSCRSLSENNSSYVIGLLSKAHPCDTSSLRITFGRSTTKEDIDYAILCIHDAIVNP